jgi:hypothetical protein
MSGIAHNIREIAGNQKPIAILGKVIKLNEDEKTCDVEPLNEDAILYDVRLSSVLDSEQGLCVFPKLDSIVIVVLLDEASAYIGLVNEVKKIELKIGNTYISVIEDKILINCNVNEGIVFNGGNLGGMVVVGNLVNAYNDLVSIVNQLITKFNTHTHPVATTGTAAAQTGTAAVTTVTQTITANATSSSALENSKIKQ